MIGSESVKERLVLYIKYKGIGQRKFEASCGLSNGYVNNIRKSIQPDKLQKIVLRFPDLNAGWLMTGEGEMIKNSGNLIHGDVKGGVVQSGGRNQNINIALPEAGKQKIIRPDGTVEVMPETIKGYIDGVPYYNVDFVGGFDLVINDQTINPEYLIDFKEYNKATCWCNITGHSMEPEINSGDIIALKDIPDASFLPYGEIYAIVTTNGMRTVKRIGPASAPDCYALIPTNKAPEFGIQEIPKDKILKVYQVLGCMKRL